MEILVDVSNLCHFVFPEMVEGGLVIGFIEQHMSKHVADALVSVCCGRLPTHIERPVYYYL